MKPQNQVEGALPLLAVVVSFASALLSGEAAYWVAIGALLLLAIYLFFRKEW